MIINNKLPLIDVGDNRIVKLANKGAVRIGNGHYLSGTKSIEIAPKAEYEGCLCYNSEAQKLEIANASKWKPLGGQLTTNDTMIWNIIL